MTHKATIGREKSFSICGVQWHNWLVICMPFLHPLSIIHVNLVADCEWVVFKHNNPWSAVALLIGKPNCIWNLFAQHHLPSIHHPTYLFNNIDWTFLVLPYVLRVCADDDDGDDWTMGAEDVQDGRAKTECGWWWWGAPCVSSRRYVTSKMYSTLIRNSVSI